MIFVAVGTQLSFDRLVRGVDDWAVKRDVESIVAQVGPSYFQPRKIKALDYISPQKFAELQKQSRLLIGHAGMGTILGALELQKPLIIMPRLARFGEHRNDHQLATVRHFSGKSGIYVAENEADLHNLLDRRDELVASTDAISSAAQPELIQAISSFILSGKF